jgi:hypothetical protein
MLKHSSDLLQGGRRYATGLRSFLSSTIDLAEAKAIQTWQLENREETFLRVLEMGIYNNTKSPYLRLLQHAGFRFEDIQSQVLSKGLESALSELCGHGVYVTLDEFKAGLPSSGLVLSSLWQRRTSITPYSHHTIKAPLAARAAAERGWTSTSIS